MSAGIGRFLQCDSGMDPARAEVRLNEERKAEWSEKVAQTKREVFVDWLGRFCAWVTFRTPSDLISDRFTASRKLAATSMELKNLGKAENDPKNKKQKEVLESKKEKLEARIERLDRKTGYIVPTYAGFDLGFTAILATEHQQEASNRIHHALTKLQPLSARKIDKILRRFELTTEQVAWLAEFHEMVNRVEQETGSKPDKVALIKQRLWKWFDGLSLKDQDLFKEKLPSLKENKYLSPTEQSVLRAFSLRFAAAKFEANLKRFGAECTKDSRGVADENAKADLARDWVGSLKRSGALPALQSALEEGMELDDRHLQQMVEEAVLPEFSWKLRRWQSQGSADGNREEAARRIKLAKDIDAPYLLLTDLGLTGLPDIFDSLPNLSGVDLSGNKIRALPKSLVELEMFPPLVGDRKSREEESL